MSKKYENVWEWSVIFRPNSQVCCSELGQSLGFMLQTLAVMAGSPLLSASTAFDTNLVAGFSHNSSGFVHKNCWISQFFWRFPWGRDFIKVDFGENKSSFFGQGQRCFIFASNNQDSGLMEFIGLPWQIKPPHIFYHFFGRVSEFFHFCCSLKSPPSSQSRCFFPHAGLCRLSQMAESIKNRLSSESLTAGTNILQITGWGSLFDLLEGFGRLSIVYPDSIHNPCEPWGTKELPRS